MAKRIYQSEFCNVCRHKPVCNSTKCSDFSRLEDCRCDELQEKMNAAKKHLQDVLVQAKLKAKDITYKDAYIRGRYEKGIAEVIEMLVSGDTDEHGPARTDTDGNGDK